jgi:uncharacterized RDD family membrane protein YckC
MNCPVCQKLMSESLSICPSCGAMRDDEVREEVMGSVIHVSKPLKIELEEVIESPELVYEEDLAPSLEEPAEIVIDVADEGPEEIWADVSETLDEIELEFEDADTRELNIEELSEEAQSLPLFDSIKDVRDAEEISDSPADLEYVDDESSIETPIDVAGPEAATLEQEVLIEGPELELPPTTAPVIAEPIAAGAADSKEERKPRDTGPLNGRNTGKIVIEFQNRNSDEPAWKQSLRNRLSGLATSTESDDSANESSVTVRKTGTTDAIGSTTLEAVGTVDGNSSSVVKNSAAPELIKERALRRIEESRRQFGIGGGTPSSNSGAAPAIPSDHEEREPTPVVRPIVTPQPQKGNSGDISPPGSPRIKIHLVPQPQRDRSTKRLDSDETEHHVENTVPENVSTESAEIPLIPPVADEPREPVEVAVIEEMTEVETIDATEAVEDEPHQLDLPDLEDEDEFEDDEYLLEEYEEEEEEEIADLAPLGQRFNAGLFDMLICAFASFVAMTPYIAMGENIVSSTGLLLFVAVCSLITIVYQTFSIAFKGKTFGMRLFALELVDLDMNEYPTFGQAFFNAVTFVMSLATLGLGFIPLFISPEKRALHDIVSGTLMVREY